MKQLDSSDDDRIAEYLVGFVEAQDVPRGRGLHEWFVHHYTCAVYRRPFAPNNSAVVRCVHEHRDLDAAKRCLLRLLCRMTQDQIV